MFSFFKSSQKPPPRATSPAPLVPTQFISTGPQTLTIDGVISKLNWVKFNYTHNVEESLYLLNLFSTPVGGLSSNDLVDWLKHLFELPEPLIDLDALNDDQEHDNKRIAMIKTPKTNLIPDEPVPATQFPIMMGAILQCCDYIIKNYYPYRDDACELFIIQAQAIVRYGDWDNFPKILKFCQFAQFCLNTTPSLTPTPSSSVSSTLINNNDDNPDKLINDNNTLPANLIQQERVDKLFNIGYGFKYKSMFQRTLYTLISTWFGVQAFIWGMDYFFPMQYTRTELGFMEVNKYVTSEDGDNDDDDDDDDDWANETPEHRQYWNFVRNIKKQHKIAGYIQNGRDVHPKLAHLLAHHNSDVETLAKDSGDIHKIRVREPHWQ